MKKNIFIVLALMILFAATLTLLPNKNVIMANEAPLSAEKKNDAEDKADAAQKSAALLKTQITDGMSPDIERIVKKGELTVATTILDQQPMYWQTKDGQFLGPDFELAQGIADALGVKLNILRWSDDYMELQNAVLSGKADIVIACYSNTLERSKYLSFTEPYLTVGYGIMVNSSNLIRYGIEQDPVGFMLENSVKIGALGGSAHVSAAQSLFPNCEIVEVFLEPEDKFENAYDKAAKMVADGELFAYFCVELEFVLQYLTQEELSIYTTSYIFNEMNDTYAVGVNRDDKALLEFINLYLGQKDDFTVKQIIVDYVEKTKGE